jgi:hypothetical protein
MIVPLVRHSKDVEDGVAIEDHAIEVAEVVGHTLHLAIVVAHQEVILDEVAERGIEMKRVHLTVADELVLEHHALWRCPDARWLSCRRLRR